MDGLMITSFKGGRESFTNLFRDELYFDVLVIIGLF